MSQDTVKDFSHIFGWNDAKKRAAAYYSQVCKTCGGMCCTYNTSPVSSLYTISFNLDDENVIKLKKALRLNLAFRKRFLENVEKSLAYQESLGFGRGQLDKVKQKGFSLASIVEAYMQLDREIAEHNKAMYKENTDDSLMKVVNTCFMLAPGVGCIMGEYKSYTCITAFRKCFKNLKLLDFVEANIHTVTGDELLEYIQEDFKICALRVVPRIIVGAPEHIKSQIARIFHRKESAVFGSLSYYQVARLADFITFPFLHPPACLQEQINRDIFYLMETIKDPPPITFVESIYPGDEDNSFDFGLDYVQLFQVRE